MPFLSSWARCFGLAVSLLVALFGCSQSVRPELEVRARPALDSEMSTASAAEQTVATTDRAAAKRRGTGVAVVELFTSEGCSSCPPADRVLSRVASRARASSLPVFTLSFHVDYWNYLGWRDRFSSSEYSERQRGYRSINPSGGTYTPQAIINGEAECVGSDAARIDQLVAAALQRAERTHLELEATRSEGGVMVRYRGSGETTGRVLNLALLEPRAESAVKSGENAGERLAHVNVVRAFQSHPFPQSAMGTWSFKLGSEFNGRPIRIVAYAEDATMRDVSGASLLELD